MTAWFRQSIVPDPPFNRHAGLREIFGREVIAGAEANAEPGGSIHVLRKAFAVGAAESNPARVLVRENPCLWFWTALLSEDAEARQLALGLPPEAVAAACDEFVRDPWSPLKDVVVRALESSLPHAWEHIDTALSKSGYDHASPHVRKAIAGSMFIGAADGLVLEGTQVPLRRSADWFLAACQQRRDFDPDVRCMAIPALVHCGKYSEASRVWSEAARCRAPVQLAGPLMRTFIMWLPVVESGGPVPVEAVQWLVDRVEGVDSSQGPLRMSLAMCSACLRLYRWCAGPPLEPLARAYEEKQVTAAQVAAFALYCWIRNEVETGLDALRLIDHVWPKAEEERFPIVCAHALLLPKVALGLRAQYSGPTEQFLRRGAPSHTRCFFWSLALASLGDVELARGLKHRALQEDPMARVRAIHWGRVALDV